MLLLTRRGVLVEEAGATYLADSDSDGDSDEARALRPPCTYRIAFGPRAGLQGVHGARHDTALTQALCADECWRL